MFRRHLQPAVATPSVAAVAGGTPSSCWSRRPCRRPPCASPLRWQGRQRRPPPRPRLLACRPRWCPPRPGASRMRRRAGWGALSPPPAAPSISKSPPSLLRALWRCVLAIGMGRGGGGVVAAVPASDAASAILQLCLAGFSAGCADASAATLMTSAVEYEERVLIRCALYKTEVAVSLLLRWGRATPVRKLVPLPTMDGVHGTLLAAPLRPPTVLGACRLTSAAGSALRGRHAAQSKRGVGRLGGGKWPHLRAGTPPEAAACTVWAGALARTLHPATRDQPG